MMILAMIMIFKCLLSAIDFATRYSTRYSDFLSQPYSNPTRSQKTLLAGAWSQGTVNNIQLNTLMTTKVKLDKNVLCVDISCVSRIGKGDQGILTKRTWNTSHAPLYLIGNSLSKQILQKLNVYQNTRMVWIVNWLWDVDKENFGTM